MLVKWRASANNSTRMKKCTYCGKEYPDTAAACALDGEPLVATAGAGSRARKKVTGVWRGRYGYVRASWMPEMETVPFTFKLKQGWFAHFTGSVTENVPPGMPGTGSLDGYFNPPAVRFTKQMPVAHIRSGDRSMTLREYVIAKGHACPQDLPAPPILYKGVFLDANRVQGTWSMEARRIPLPDGKAMRMAELSGYWCAEFVTDDLQANPQGGPAAPYFDKALLPVLDEHAIPELVSRHLDQYCRLGQFTEVETEKLLAEFDWFRLRYETNRGNQPLQPETPLPGITGAFPEAARLAEIFVHPEDEEQARTILEKAGFVSVAPAPGAEVPSSAAAEENPEEPPPPGYACLARLEPFDAKRLLNRLEAAAIPFQIDTGERRRVTGRGTRKTVYIEIFVPTADYQKANELHMADWKV